MEVSKQYRWALFVFCFLLIAANWTCAQELFPPGDDRENFSDSSEERTTHETISPEISDQPSESSLPIGACYINYGFSLGTRGGFHYMSQKGFFQVNKDQNIGTIIDTRRDIGLDRFASDYVVGGNINLNGLRVSFDYANSNFTGDRLLSQAIIIDGVQYNAGIQLYSDIKFDWYKISVGYNVFANQYFGIGPAIRCDIIKWQYEFRGLDTATNTVTKLRESGVIGIPNGGIQVDFSFVDSFVCTFSVYGMVFRQDGIDAEQAHVSLMPRWYLNDSIFVYGEAVYEYLQLNADRKGDIVADLTFHTFYFSVGVGARF